MDGFQPINAKISVKAIRINADGSREDLGDLLLTQSTNTEEQKWPEQ